MEPGVLRTRLYWIAGGYAAVVAFSAALIVMRYVQYAMHPADAAQYSGMWAGGDLILELFICGLLLVMTLILALVIMGDESAYTMYAKGLLGVSLTMPLSVGFIAIPVVNQAGGVLGVLGYACLFRLFASPLVIFGIGVSRLLARFPRPKRLIVYGLLIEVSTLVLLIASLGVFSHLRQE